MKVIVTLDTADGSLDVNMDGTDIIGLNCINFNQCYMNKDMYGFNAYRNITDDNGVQKSESWSFTMPDMNVSHKIEDTPEAKKKQAVIDYFKKVA